MPVFTSKKALSDEGLSSEARLGERKTSYLGAECLSLRLLPSAKSTSLCTREALNRSYPAKISARITPSAATRRFISVSMLSLIPAVSALMVIVAQPLTGML